MSEDRRELGFVVLLRQVQSSDLWRSLRADQRGVFVQLLLLANWKPRKARWKDQWYEVGRGELAHTLATIAEESAASVKVVRTTLEALMADDRPAGGNGPAVTERYPVPGTGPGTGPRVLTIVNYDRFQSVPEDAGTGPGTEPARVGHRPGTDRAEREPREPDQPGEPGGAGGDACLPWSELRALLEGRVRADLFARWFAPLVGRVEGEQLLLEAPSPWHRTFVEDNYRAELQRLLADLNHPLQVRVVSAAQRAAGGRA